MSSQPIATMPFAATPSSPISAGSPNRFTSPTSSFTASPRSFNSSPNGFTPSPTDSMLDIFPRYSSSTVAPGPSCAFPSWPSGKSLASFPGSTPNSFISDEDLFPEDLADDEIDMRSATLLREAPAPPRIRPLPPPAMVRRPQPEKPKKRTRSATKPKRSSKPMKTIAETSEELE